MKKVRTRYSEIMLSSRCVLKCDGCSNYSNYNPGPPFMDTEDGLSTIRNWGQRIEPAQFRILGGEPLLHPNFNDFVYVVAQTWPKAIRSVVSNGILVPRRNDVKRSFIDTGTELHVSIHSNDPAYVARMTPVLKELKTWIAEGVRVSIGDHRIFHRLYNGIGYHMKPSNEGNPFGSWNTCLSNHCINLKNQRLWKCPMIAYLPEVLERFNVLDSEEWKPYLSYKGLSLDCSDEELKDFTTKGHENICTLCTVNKAVYYKDIYNTDFTRTEDRLEVHYPDVGFSTFTDLLK